jgi:methionyl-tRNA synthetase
LRFHAVIWPALLMAHDLPLPRRVVANGWLMVGGEKMSKSNLTGISPRELTDQFGVDAYRWYFLRAIPYGQNGSFSWEDLHTRYTTELGNEYGNLQSRVAGMIGKYFGGILPEPVAVGDAETAIHRALAHAATEADRRVGENLDFAGGIAAIFDYIKRVNLYLSEQQPWQVAKDPHAQAQGRLATILYTAAESLRAVAVLLNPIMPTTSLLLWESLGASAVVGRLSDQRIQHAGAWGQLPPGAAITKNEVLFPRIDA